MRTLVVGLGNPILTDEGVGICVVEELANHAKLPDVDLAEACVGGLRLLDTLAGYERVILVDAIQTRGGTPGEIYRLHPNDLKVSLHAGSTLCELGSIHMLPTRPGVQSPNSTRLGPVLVRRSTSFGRASIACGRHLERVEASQPPRVRQTDDQRC